MRSCKRTCGCVHITCANPSKACAKLSAKFLLRMGLSALGCVIGGTGDDGLEPLPNLRTLSDHLRITLGSDIIVP